MFVFDGKKVVKMIEHAQKATLHRPTYEQCYKILGRKWFEGKVKAETIYDKIPAGLHFVKDSGVYLMSNGYPQEKPARVSGLICYAKGFGTDGPHIGGDDFVDHVPLDIFLPGDLDHMRKEP